MSNDEKTGGQAFPRAGFAPANYTCDRGEAVGLAHGGNDGMTYRQWLAGKALTGLVNIQPVNAMLWNERIEWIAKAAVQFADAVIAAEKK
jgi:hypothetical protein